MMDGMPGVRHEPTVAREDAGAAPSDDEFEFPFGCGAAPEDELLAGGGRVRAFYPVFGRILDLNDAAPEHEPPRAPLGRLFHLERARTSSVASTSSSSSSASTDAAAGGDLDAAPPDSYCLWTPGSSPASSPSRPSRKSGSTGSMARWRHVGDLVVGRSQSDGREKFRFLSAPPSPAREYASSNPKAKKQPARGSKAAGATEVDTVAAGRRTPYGGAKGGPPGARRTFLPYRQDLVGLFANVHGLSRSHHHHPF